MSHKPKLGWLYLLIVLCMLFSGVMTWGLFQKLAEQKEGADAYQALSGEVVATGGIAFPDETVAPEALNTASEGEAEDQSDTVFFINNDVVSITSLPTATPQISPTPGHTATASQSSTAKTTPAASVTQTAGSGWAVVTPTPAPGSGWAVVTPTPAPGSGWSLTTPIPTKEAAVSGAATATGSAASPTKDATAALQGTPLPTAGSVFTAKAASTEEPRFDLVVHMQDVHYSVDFPYLQTINPDVKAWLIQENTPINYPVMQAKDNEYYLDRMFNLKYNKNGSIFLDSGSSALFIDANTYIYGHHTKTDAMFSTLANYKEQAYYDAHPQMILLTPYSDFAIDIFASRVCLVDDETSWRVKQFTRKAEFTQYIAQLEAQSLIHGKAASMPQWGDQLLVLVTCTNEHHGERYVLYGRMRQIVYGSNDSVTVTKMTMDDAPTLSTLETVPGRGKMMVYAQNDPLWADLRYESRGSSKHRTFGAGGCGPTSVAMAVVNIVPKERLSDIFGYAKNSMGFTFCECSVNQYYCNKLHAQYQIQTAEEYLRYYPLVMASFATGNNYWGQVSRGSGSGTSLAFIKKIAYLYKLDLSITYSNDEAFTAVRNGAVTVASLGSDNPFTGGGHYVVVANADDQYVYILDPYRKESYADTDRQHLLTSLAPGVVRVSLADAGNLGMSTFYILKATAQTASPEPPAAQ